MQEKKSKTIVKTMASVSGIVILAKVLGLLKQIIVADAFGATLHTDIISIAEGLVANTDYLIVQALSTAFVPIYINCREENKEQTNRFVSNTILLCFLITLLIGTVFFAASPILSRILAPSYSADHSARLSFYIRCFAPAIIIIVELAVFNSLLKANEQFIPGELIGFNQSLILIALVLLIGQKVGPDTIVIGFYLYAIFNLVFLMVRSRKLWVFAGVHPLRDPNVRKMLVMMGPLLLGYSMVFVNQQVDKVIVSGLGEGSVTSMTYAAVLSNFVCTFIGSINAVLFTYTTQNIAEKKDQEAAELASHSVIQLVTLLIPISLLTIFNASDIVRIVFGRGKFDSRAVEACAYALSGYGAMFIPYVLREVFSRVQYAYGDSKTPMINSTIAIAVNIVLSIIMSRFFGVLGVTLATSISVLVCGVLNIRSSVKKNHFLRTREVMLHLPRWLIGSAICIAIVLIGRKFLLDINVLIRFVVITFLSLAAFFAVNYSDIKMLLSKIIH